ELEKRLDELKELQAAVLAASDAYVNATEPADKQNKREALQAAEDNLDHWAQGLAKITLGDLDVALSGLGNVTGDDFDVDDMLAKGITIQPGKKDGKLVGSVLAEGEIVPGAGLARLEGVAGKVFYSKDQIEFTDLTIGDLYGQEIDYADDKNQVRSRGRTGAVGVTLSGTVKLKEHLNDELEPTRKLDELVIRRLDVKALYASGFDVRTPDFNLDMPEGYISGVHLEGVTVKMPSGLVENESPKITGFFGLEAFRIKQLGLKVGKTLEAGGTFRGRGLSIDLVSDKKRVVRLADLNATSAKVLLPGSGIRVYFNAHGLSLHVEQNGDRIIVHRVNLGDITLSHSYISAAGVVIDVRKQLAMRNVRASAEVKTYKKKDGSTGVGRILVTELVVG